MKKNYKLFTLLTFIGLTSYNCSIEFGNNLFHSGTVVTSVKFPEKNTDKTFNIKTIPIETESIVVKVEGQGIATENPVFFQLTRANPKKVLEKIPTGSKKIFAKAYDKDGTLIANGDNIINVLENRLNRVEVNLTPIVKANLKVDPIAVPIKVQVPCIIRIEEKDMPISKSLEKSIIDSGCTIEYPSVSIPVMVSSPTPTPTATTTSTSGNSNAPLRGAASVNTNLSLIEGPDISNGPITLGP
ncbi:MAG: hypothetical protein U0457_15120 [Candidatus Sericytochromatia bacterium]